MANELCWFCISLFIFVAVRRNLTGLFSLLKTSSIWIIQHSSFPLNNFSIKTWSFHTYYDKRIPQSSRPVMLQHTSASVSSILLMKCIYSNFVILFYSDCKPCLRLGFHFLFSGNILSSLFSWWRTVQTSSAARPQIMGDMHPANVALETIGKNVHWPQRCK